MECPRPRYWSDSDEAYGGPTTPSTWRTSTFSGREINSVLTDFGYQPVSRSGSHVRRRYEHPKTGAVRNVDVRMHAEVGIGTLRSIADQCVAEDFEAWCHWIDEHS